MSVLKMKLIPLMDQKIYPEQIHRQTDRPTDTQAHRQTDRQTETRLELLHMHISEW